MLIAIRESLFSCLIPSPPELEIVCVKIGQSNNYVAFTCLLSLLFPMSLLWFISLPNFLHLSVNVFL